VAGNQVTATLSSNFVNALQCKSIHYYLQKDSPLYQIYVH